jgi:hypothetical protein
MPILDTALAFALTMLVSQSVQRISRISAARMGTRWSAGRGTAWAAGLYEFSALSLPLAWQDWAHPSGTMQSEASRTLSSVHAQPGNLNNWSALSWNLCSD